MEKTTGINRVVWQHNRKAMVMEAPKNNREGAGWNRTLKRHHGGNRAKCVVGKAQVVMDLKAL